MMMRGPYVALVTALLLAGCESHEPGAGRTIESLTGPAIQRHHDPVQVAQGAVIYRQHCAECHGQNAEGNPDWRHRDTSGMFLPPPLNGTGHAWHHSIAWHKQMILDGSLPGQGNMPGWRGKLSETEVEAVISWFQSLWPDQVYAAWYEMPQRNK